MKRLVIESQDQELKALELLGLLGFEWLDGTAPEDFIPSIDSSSWKSFPFILLIDQVDKDLTWEEHC